MLVEFNIRYCVDCRAPTRARRARCDDCQHKSRQKKDREGYYRRQGKPYPDAESGAEVKCFGCSHTIIKTRADHVFCDDCLRGRANSCGRIKRESDRRARGIKQKTGAATCIKCGSAFTRNSINHRICVECRPKRKGPTRGSAIRCEDCRVEIIAYNGNRFCRGCAKERERVSGRIAARDRFRSKNPLCRPIGSKINCLDCQTEFVKASGPQMRCEPCRVTYPARYMKGRRRSDVKLNLSERMKRGINLSLQKGAKRRRHWEMLVGFTLTDLILHLERQFLPGMTWANRADWHVDHIVPLKSFKFETPDDPEFMAAWALHNLRPLWASDNARKSGNRIHLI